jgi:hypothetical protein
MNGLRKYGISNSYVEYISHNGTTFMELGKRGKGKEKDRASVIL